MKSTTLHNSYETNLPPLARSATAIAVGSVLLLASTGAFAQCATGGTVNITADCTGGITADNLSVTATTAGPSVTVTGDVSGQSATFSDNVLTLKAGNTNAATKYYGRITGNVSNFGTINLDYTPASGNINGAATAAAALPSVITGTIATGGASDVLNLNVLAPITTAKFFNLSANIQGAGGVVFDLTNTSSFANSTRLINLVLTGNNNTYTGLTTVKNGVLQIGNGTNFSFDANNNIRLEGAWAGVHFSNPSGSPFTYDGVISSEGHDPTVNTFTKSGAGTLILTQNQTYTGNTTVSAGTLQIGTGGATGNIGAGTLTITGATTNVIVDTTTDLHWTAVSNAGTFTKNQNNTLIVDGAFGGAGKVQITDGTLQLGSGENAIILGAASSPGKFAIASGTSLVIDYAIRSDMAITHYNAGNFVTLGAAANNSLANATTSGDGELIKNGARTLILLGYLAHTGGTTVNEGTLQLGNNTTNATLDPGFGDIDLKSGTTLRTGGPATSIPVTIKGDGNLVANLSYNQATGANYCTSSCLTTLSGDLQYTGTTEVAVGTLTLSGSASLTNTSALILQNGTTLNDTTGATQNLKRLDVYGQPTYNGSFTAQNINFIIPNTVAAGSSLLTVAGSGNTANIGGSTITVVIAGNSSPLTIGDSVNLFNFTGGATLTGNSANDSTLGLYGPVAGATQGSLLGYSFDLQRTSDNVRAIVKDVQLRPEAKSLSEGYLSGTAALTRSSDFLASHGIAAARAQLAKTYGADDDGKDIPEKGLWGSGVQPFYAYSAGRLKHNSGSYVNTEGYNFIAGAVAGFRTGTGQAIAGAFFEYGKGEYDTYNSFASGKVTGDGNTYHRGFGFFGRIDVKDGYYVEGSIRKGKLDTKYQSDSLRDFFGTRAAYTSKTAYTGAHFGAGKVWPLKGISDKLSLDTYGQALWTRQDADTVTITTGERIAFESITSERLKAGARARYDVSDRSAAYVGFAYDHEFGAEARAKLAVSGNKIESPKLSGGTGVAEIGFLVTPTADSPYSADLGIQAYTGKREGVVGSLRFNYYF